MLKLYVVCADRHAITPNTSTSSPAAECSQHQLAVVSLGDRLLLLLAVLSLSDRLLLLVALTPTSCSVGCSWSLALHACTPAAHCVGHAHLYVSCSLSCTRRR